MTDYRDLLIEMADDGMIDYREALIACLKWMSMDSVMEMMKENEFMDIRDEYDIEVQDAEV